MRALPLLLLGALTACGPSGNGRTPATPDASGSFALYGLPGPWSRDGADRDDFERESRGCRRRSRQARAEAPPGERSDAAYRAFLDCMEDRRWIRGGAAPGSQTG
jgi:hypothetical protein